MALTTHLLPKIYLKVDGRTESDKEMESVLSIEVDDSLSLPDMIAVHLSIDDDRFALGKAIEVLVVEDKKEISLISGEITAIEPRFNSLMGPTVIVRGYDRSHRLNRERKSRSFVQMKISEIIHKMAKEASLKSNIVATGQAHEHLLQNNMTDWEYGMHLARRVGYRLYVEGDVLHFVKKPATVKTPVIQWPDDLLEFNARLSTSGQCSEVIVQGWDPARQQQIVGRATTPEDMPQIGESRHGGQAVKEAFGIAAKDVIVNRPVANQSEAAALAQAICNEKGRRFVEGECVCKGNPLVQAGNLVNLEGVGGRFCGTYRVTHALHTYDFMGASGYLTRFTIGGSHASLAELVAPDESDAVSSHCPMLGVVTNNDDPDKLGRVKVKYPTLSNSHESHWARLVALGAGKDRGMVWIPDVGDEVLVVFEHEDINRPIVVGGLWSQKSPPADSSNLVASGKSVAFHIDTHQKMGLKIMDSSNDTSLNLGDADNHLAISKTNRKVDLKSADKVNIEGMNISLSAQSNLEIKSSGNIKIEASGVVEIKGAMIKLN